MTPENILRIKEVSDVARPEIASLISESIKCASDGLMFAGLGDWVETRRCIERSNRLQAQAARLLDEIRNYASDSAILEVTRIEPIGSNAPWSEIPRRGKG